MSANNEYILLFRGNDWSKSLSPEEMQQVAGQWMAWFKGLTENGKVIAGNPLENKGKVVSGRNGRVVADGPFAESKEAVGGYFLLHVDSMDEAVAIAQQCPGLPYGAKVEVRPVLEQCPLLKEALPEAELAEATA
ncbi:MAG: YciI family protein [Limisphaerales bacterium]